MLYLSGSILVTLLVLTGRSGSFVVDDDESRHVNHRIFTTNGAPWGTWSEQEFCPNGTFANGFKLKIEPAQGDGDDTSLNGITLTCGGQFMQGALISSAVGPWGFQIGETKCNNGEYLVAFQLNVEANQGFGDDTAVNDIKFMCRNYTGGNLNQIYSYNYNQVYGTWGPWSAPCPANSAICGLSVKLEGPQDAGFIHRDDTAINDVQFVCCDDYM